MNTNHTIQPFLIALVYNRDKKHEDQKFSVHILEEFQRNVN